MQKRSWERWETSLWVKVMGHGLMPRPFLVTMCVLDATWLGPNEDLSRGAGTQQNSGCCSGHLWCQMPELEAGQFPIMCSHCTPSASVRTGNVWVWIVRNPICRPNFWSQAPARLWDMDHDLLLHTFSASVRVTNSPKSLFSSAVYISLTSVSLRSVVMRNHT